MVTNSSTAPAVAVSTWRRDVIHQGCLQAPRRTIARSATRRRSECQLTPSIDALYTPDIDASLDEETSKRDFWRAFKALGEWYADMPPY